MIIREFLRPLTTTAAFALTLAAAPTDARREPERQQPGVPPGEWLVIYPRPAVGKYEDFAFPDEKHGWLISASGTIFVTGDGGDTWAVQATGKGRLRSVDFLDAKHGY